VNFLRAVIFVAGSIYLFGGCTYEAPRYSDVCKTDFFGFPDVPGWNFTEFHWDTKVTSLSNFYFITENKGFFYDYQGIWRTENQGVTVEKVYSGQSLFFKDFSFIDSLHGVASVILNHDGYILKTDDSGLSWSLLYTQTNNRIEQVSFRDSLVGFASFYRVPTGITIAGHYHAKSIDGGLTWQEIPELSAPKYGDANIRLFPNGFGYISGDHGELHLTNDGGDTWSTIQTGLDVLKRIQFIDQNTGFASDYGSLFRTIDDGISWTKISENAILMFHFFSATDGISFQIVHSDYADGGDWPTHCNAFFSTSDGGLTWNEGPVSPNFYIRNYYFVNAGSGFISYSGWSDGVKKLYR